VNRLARLWTSGTSPLTRLRLRHKLAISLSIAALLPVAVAAWVAVSIMLRGLERDLRDETEQQLSVGLNLVLRNVERFGQDAVRLSSSRSLSTALTEGAEAVESVLADEDPLLPSSLVQIADETGHIVATRVVGEKKRFESIGVPSKHQLIRDGLAYERKVKLVVVNDVLVVRAVAPIVDQSYMLQGVVVLSAPMDGDFADGVKGALGTDVLLLAAGHAHTTFVDDTGARIEDHTIPVGVSEHVRRGRTVLDRAVFLDREYAVGYTPIRNLAGETVGMFGVAVDRAPVLTARRAAMRSLALGAAGAFVFALGLAGLLSRRLTRQIGRLHRGAIAIARGDLDYDIAVKEGDEIGDLASAFTHMTKALKENQQRLAARMRELVALHDAGRAVSSVLGIEQLLRKIVDAVSRVLDVRLCTVWLVRGDEMLIGAGRAKPTDMNLSMRGDNVKQLAQPLEAIAREVSQARATLRVDRIAEDERRRDAAVAAGVTGSLIATPLERKGEVVGVIIIGRTRDARPFSEADSNLLATFADQAATAIENARLYEEVRAFNEELEQKVRLRTAELEQINRELGKALRELRDTQAQLLLSERLAGLGQLVAGVAHEVNSPAAAIRGTVDTLAENVRRLTDAAERVASLPLDQAERVAFLRLVGERAPELAIAHHVTSPAAVRRESRDLRDRLIEAGVEDAPAAAAAKVLAELDAAALVDELAPLLAKVDPEVPVGYLKQYVFLHKNAETIRRAIHRVQRIVRALKSYSHLDQEPTLVPSDIHEGIENTLVLLDHELGGGIEVTRNYGELKPVAVFVDELNQVWTNLIHNAVQAVGEQGNIIIETEQAPTEVVVRVIDDGEGVPAEVLPRIFEPFFTTKPKGQGTGLGLGIVRNIVKKHHGSVTASSRPGRTCFEVRLPIDGGATAADSDRMTG
jgi:signal transduction histidine kinase